ncbi:MULTISPECIES: molybdopterin molybdotransferase MoeA [Streptomycetaceae]|uniref:Molybdopterin molybdenumtransferase n=1 Tax=Streptantibioticus cattleyicolor (strain ATCC 35852 / DSM 46488 / JCM 4925 / NBRC 14057 / NRRL 8057) TaxID=1003195 RepID=F8JX81_STREN|nr:gephyrin-like molybdotransferase Glp [Streptantibioticus cattleyicolor]AEW94546.1 putative molybdopterin biosynthesis protein [Streptantibioticus cattleyicolor NRRL 8057 = DSM 46488]MYS59186.1 molybdopterin molybdenumtransferase MoeA [Streptomyces sp. SID5468]CCB74905.1 Molybdopterin biosynthesis protein moeA 2 [Streptantibioticus cattleyicolor NRRL 8057 = DSM 46488]
MSSPDNAAGAPGRPADEDRVRSVDEHLADVLRHLTPLEPIELQLLDAQGCVLVEDVTVPVALPPFDNSSMDGYAVRTADVAHATADDPVVLKVIGDVAAGDGDLPAVGPGEAARIMTGAPLPPGAQAVVPVEWTDGGLGAGPVTAMRAHSADPAGATGQVHVYRPADTGAHVRQRGSDVPAGELALAAGTRLGPPQIALLAAIGRSRVLVRPRPRVVVISTGSELVQPGEALGPGRIHDANSFALAAAAREAGAIAYRVGAIADDPATLRSTVEDQLIRADIVVTSGGVSVGAYDVVKEALSSVEATQWGDSDDEDEEPAKNADRAAEPSATPDERPRTGTMEFRKLAMQPGKPQGFGLVGADRTPLFALPGNPVSSYVSFELFVRPAIRTLMGLEPVRREAVTARCAEPIAHSPRGRRQFLRGHYDGDQVTPVGGAGSHLVKALAHANALIVVPEDVTEVAAGEPVEVLPLG